LLGVGAERRGGIGWRTFGVTTNGQDHYLEDPVRDLERVVNGMTYKVSYLDPDHKAKARAKGKPIVVSLSDRPKLGGVRSGVAYDPKTDYYYVACHTRVGVPPRRYRRFTPWALEFARTGRPIGGEPIMVERTTTPSAPAERPRARSGEQEGGRGERPTALEGTLFDSLVERFERAYVDLRHSLGWRFLYTPRRTFDAPSHLLFVGMNPGRNPAASQHVGSVPSVEAGNAYRVETDWGARGTGHQEQVRLLYRELARRLGRDDVELLMDETLASNFCPFRSSAWDALPNPKESIEFSFELWRDVWRHVLGHVERPVMICNGKDALSYFSTVLESQGAGLLQTAEIDRVGWGEQTYEIRQYDTAVLVAVPHLSRYQIVGRTESQQAVDRIVSAVAEAITT
jgi:hypothetical protein